MKLKDLLLEKPEDYVVGHIDGVEQLYRKKKYMHEDHHDKKEGKILHFERPKTQKEAYWEERCEKDPQSPGCLIYDD